MSRSQLAEPDRIRLEELLRRFQENWTADGMKTIPGAFEAYLPPANDPLRAMALSELITLDLTSRWRIGQKVRVEFYISAFAELQQAPDRLVALIFEEYRTRALMQEAIPVHAYQERFPEHFDLFYKYVRTQAGDVETAIDDTVKAHHPIPTEENKSFVPEFSRYELVQRVGAGQFGEVWSAKAPGGVDVALKIIPWPSAHKMSQMELRALEVMKSLRHAFLVQVHAYWPMDNQVAIVMELADGSLEDRLKECRADGLIGIPRDELIIYMSESAEALDHLHSQMVLHRDIKPANILIVQGHAKVGDFGVARLLNAEQPADLRSTCVGTPQFMAPEVWENEVHPSSDQYSLAITYVELRIGRPVFMAKSLAELLRSHSTATPDLDPIPPAEQQIILKALSKRAADRFENCVEFIDALKHLVELERRELASRGERLRRRIVIGGILTVAAVAAVAPFFLIPRNSIEPDLEFPPSVSVAAGEQESFMIGLISGDEEAKLSPADLKVSGLPPGVQSTLSTFDNEGSRVQVTLNADLLQTVGEWPIVVELDSETYQLKKEFKLKVAGPNAFLPRNAKRAPHSQPVRADGKVYHSHIHVSAPDGTEEFGGLPIEFILIPRTRPTDPPTFYVMKHKVWNALYSAYHESISSSNPDISWKAIEYIAPPSEDNPLPSDQRYLASDYPLRPVFMIAAYEAHGCCEWLGGKLATEDEWEKAAGRFDFQSPEHEDYFEGPYRGKWDSDGSGIAVGDVDYGLPRDVGTSDQDESLFGCMDMAGNGREFTCQLHSHGGSAPQIPIELSDTIYTVVLEGADYRSSTPLQYDATKHLPVQHQGYDTRSDTTGFRVVISLLSE